MTIWSAHAPHLSRSNGGSAVRAVAYDERAVIMADRTGELHSFKHRDARERHEALVPERADARFADRTLRGGETPAVTFRTV